MINIKFDDKVVSDEHISQLSQGLINIVQVASGIPEVYVYADSPKIKINALPIEVFIEISASKIADRDALFGEIKTGLAEWKGANNFMHPVAVTLIPMDWKFEVGI